MAGAEFGFGEVNEYNPMYGGVDWRLRFEAQEQAAGNELPQPAWFETVDEMGELVEQLTQESAAFYINRTDPSFDCIAVQDPRDGNAYWFSRGQIGDEEFERLRHHFGAEVMTVQTKYPMQRVAEFIIGTMSGDIMDLERSGLPEDFERGNAA